MTTAGGLKGGMASARFWTPSPFFLGGHFDRFRLSDAPDLSLLYSEAGMEVLYDLPVSVSGAGHFLATWDDGRDPLYGGGLTADMSVRLSEAIEVAGDYRLSWLSGLPLHRGTARLCWNVANFAAWGGYVLVRNSEGETVDGPAAGLRLRI
jgi:hypothetical protein